MNLFKRLSTTIKADAHGVVDSVEDKGLLLKQYLREARHSLGDSRMVLEGLDGEIAETVTLVETVAEAQAAADRDISLATEQGQEKLARYAASKFLRAMNENVARQRALVGLRQRRTEQGELVVEQEGQLQELELRVAEYLRTEQQAGLRGQGPAPTGVVTPEEVDLELLRRRAARAES